jgi:hypothetical protein
MEIVAGRCRVRLKGESQWREYGAGESFSVPGNSSFDIETASCLPLRLPLQVKPRDCCPSAAMPSFDIVSEVNQVELRNAVEQPNKEITNRYDFKGTIARSSNEKDKLITLPTTISSSARSRTSCSGQDGKAQRRQAPRSRPGEKVGGNKVKQV